MSEQRGPGRPREAAADARILGSARALLREQGPAAVSIAAVAAHSGVARTTLYRRYRDRSELLTAALREVTHRGAPPSGLDVGGRVAWVLERAAEVLDEDLGPGGVAAVLTGDDPEFAAALRRALAAGLEPLLAQVADDVAAGGLAPGLDADLVVDVLLGVHLAATLRRGTPDPAWRTRTARRLAALLTPVA